MVPGVGTDTVIVTGILTLTGVFTGWLGYRIRYRGESHLIAGYRSDMDADTDSLSRTVGRVVLAVGAVTVLAGVLYPGLNMGPDGRLFYWSGYTMIVLVCSGYAIIASRRYVSAS